MVVNIKNIVNYLIVLFPLVTLAQAPAYDEPCGAMTLPVNQSADNCSATAPDIAITNITYAANITRPSSCNPSNNTNPDAWFKFTTPNNASGNSTQLSYNYGYWFSGNLAYIEIYSTNGCNSQYFLLHCWSVDVNNSAMIQPSGIPKTFATNPGQTYYIHYTRGAFDSNAPNMKLCLATGIPPEGAKIGIHNTQPQTYFDVAGDSRFRNKVGIGMLPSNALDVAGTGTFSGGLTVAENLTAKNMRMSVSTDPSTSGDKLIFDRGYNNIKYGFGFYSNPNFYGSAIQQYVWSDQDTFIWGRGDPFYASYNNPSYFAERMRLTGDGKLGLGTDAPDTKLHVNGSFKLTDGSQGAQKVLTSDANGQASWQNLPAVANTWSVSGNNIFNANAGNIGIGTNNPSSAKLVFGGAIGQEAIDAATADQYVNMRVIRNSKFALDKDMYIGYQSGTTSSLHLYSNNNETVSVKNNNLGVGDTNPGLKLSVNSAADHIASFNGGSGSYVSFWEGGQPRGYFGSFEGAATDIAFGTHTNNTNGKLHLSINNAPKLTVNTNGFVGINRTDAHVPLAFGNPFGQIALSLFKGTLGDVGMGVWSNEFRLQCDGPAGKVAFGTLDANGNYFELAKASNENQKFTVNGFINVGGTIYSSDERFKKNIKGLTGSLDKVLQLSGYEYDMRTEEYKEKLFDQKHQIGLLAQQVEQIVPEAVQEIGDGYKGVDYARLVPLLIESIKELKAEVDRLKKGN